MATKKKYQVGAFNTISLVDLLTGALGAVIALFAMVPKMQMSTMTQGGTAFLTLPVAYDQYNRMLWGETPDSLRRFAIKEGDTLTVVVTSRDRMSKDTVYLDGGIADNIGNASNNASNTDNKNPWQPRSGQGTGIEKEEVGDCLLSPTFSDFVCDDKDSPTPSDDTFTTTLDVKASKGGKSGWTAKLDGRQLARGQYGTPLKIGPLPIRQEPYTLEIADAEKGTCVVRSLITSPPPCSIEPPKEPVPGPTIAGDAVMSLSWEGVGDKLVDLNLIIRHNRMVCSGRRPKTPFAEHTTEVGIQEYIRIQGQIRNGKRQSPPAGTYEIYVHNWNPKSAPINGTAKIIVREGNNLQISKEITRTFPYEKYPGKKIGEIVLDANGKYTFKETN